jgi:hypothetical protein
MSDLKPFLLKTLKKQILSGLKNIYLKNQFAAFTIVNLRNIILWHNNKFLKTTKKRKKTGIAVVKRFT